jgi:PAS domain S-box-containing protein
VLVLFQRLNIWHALSVGPGILQVHLAYAKAQAAVHPTAISKLLDDQGRILYASPSHLEIVGYPAGTIEGRFLNQVIAPEDLDHSNLSIQDAILCEEASEIGFRHLTADGNYVAMRRHTWALPGDRHSQYYIFTRSTVVGS